MLRSERAQTKCARTTRPFSPLTLPPPALPRPRAALQVQAQLAQLTALAQAGAPPMQMPQPPPQPPPQPQPQPQSQPHLEQQYEQHGGGDPRRADPRRAGGGALPRDGGAGDRQYRPY